MHALKIENFPSIDTQTMDTISNQLKDIASELDLREPTEMECRSRDGYIPHSWNQGGWRAYGYTVIDMVVGSGMFSGSDSFNDLIENYYVDELKECIKKFNEDHNTNYECYSDMNEDHQSIYESQYEQDWFCSDYNSISVEYQGRYLGYENGIHTISLNVFLCASDAPYHRRSDDDIEIEISFRDINAKNAQDKIKKAVKKLQDFIGSLELY